jgi:hypothetical protein
MCIEPAASFFELARVETLLGVWRGVPGRPPGDRRHPDDEDADRAADGGQAIAPAVRLGAPRFAACGVWQIADIMSYGQETRGFAAATGG